MKKTGTYLATVIVVLCCSVFAAAQQRVRIAGLESNPQYRALTAEEARLAKMSDSISTSMDNVRRAFRTDTLNRAALTTAILRMEEEMFGLRNRMAGITGQINAIEQEWILKNLENETGPERFAQDSVADDGPQVRNLVYNTYFDRNLRPEDLAELREAQETETRIPELAEQFSENNQRLRLLKYAYDLALAESTADSIKNRFDSLARVNRSVDRNIHILWNSVFDNKSYAYNFLMDKNNRGDLLDRYTQDLDKLRSQQTEWTGIYASDEIVTYVLQKRLLTEYEIMLAQDLGYNAAADSLRRVYAALQHVDKLEGLGPVALKKRLFLEYEEISLHTAAQYGARKPIPEVKIYPNGIIYRVLLGTYSAVQQPSAFRNVAPIAVQKGPDNKYRYFAGGFPNDSTANAAVEQMRKRGFKKPEAVVWMDGVYINLATGKGLADAFYRVELSGVGELSAEVKEAIRTATGGKDIMRGDGVFIVGPLDNAAEAVRLRTSLERRDPEMEIKITEFRN